VIEGGREIKVGDYDWSHRGLCFPVAGCRQPITCHDCGHIKVSDRRLGGLWF